MNVPVIRLAVGVGLGASLAREQYRAAAVAWGILVAMHLVAAVWEQACERAKKNTTSHPPTPTGPRPVA